MPDDITDTSYGSTNSAATHSPGASSALGELYHAHHASLVRLVKPLVDTIEAAEEVVHDVFDRMLRTGCFPDQNPGGYLRTAALNAARSELRRREKVRRHHRSVASQQLPEFEAGVEEPLVRRLDAAALDRHLSELAPRQRDVIALRFISGLREREVAERLGISPGSVKTHTSRGLQALRARITEELYGA